MEYHRMRAPSEDGAAFVSPPLWDAGRLLDQNRARRSTWNIDIAGVSLTELAKEARRELIDQAVRYSLDYRIVKLSSDATASDRIILSGHQPQLFHAGVWFKNYVLSHLGERLNATAVNLIIDNDVLTGTSIRVPMISAGRLGTERITFDQPVGERPFEDRSIQDSATFGNFPSQVLRTVGRLIGKPTVRSLWPLALEARERTNNLGRCIAQARHRLEEQIGLQTLEVPLSCICDTAAFRRFAAFWWRDAARLRAIYNAGVAEYRRVHQIRSRTHPVPELIADGEWIETPFWVWTSADPRRRRLFVRSAMRSIEITDREHFHERLDGSGGDGEKIPELLSTIAGTGVRIRPRALITTMYARLMLSDLFIHGIGGGKYDQLTDWLISQVFSIDPPEYLIATATCRLPMSWSAPMPNRLPLINNQLRQLQFNPENLAEDMVGAAPLVAEKIRWLQNTLPRGQRRPRHIELQRINSALQPFVVDLRAKLLQERDQLLARHREHRVLTSRDYPFCLFPLQRLVDRLLEVLSAHANFR